MIEIGSNERLLEVEYFYWFKRLDVKWRKVKTGRTEFQAKILKKRIKVVLRDLQILKVSLGRIASRAGQKIKKKLKIL